MNYKDYILRCIEDYMLEFCKEPIWGVSRRHYSFELASYNRATVKEILCAIKDSDLPPAIVVEDFAKKMDIFACKARTNQSKQMFSIAHDMAVCIGDFLMALK